MSTYTLTYFSTKKCTNKKSKETDLGANIWLL